MEAVGSLGFPLRRPRQILRKPPPASRVAQGFFDAVLVELTRPVQDAFTVRIFDEGLRRSAADVAAVFVLYGADVAGVGLGLETLWREQGLRAEAAVRYVCYRSYDHSSGYAAVLRTIEELQELFLP